MDCHAKGKGRPIQVAYPKEQTQKRHQKRAPFEDKRRTVKLLLQRKTINSEKQALKYKVITIITTKTTEESQVYRQWYGQAKLASESAPSICERERESELLSEEQHKHGVLEEDTKTLRVKETGLNPFFKYILFLF